MCLRDQHGNLIGFDFVVDEGSESKLNPEPSVLKIIPESGVESWSNQLKGKKYWDWDPVKKRDNKQEWGF